MKYINFIYQSADSVEPHRQKNRIGTFFQREKMYKTQQYLFRKLSELTIQEKFGAIPSFSIDAGFE